MANELAAACGMSTNAIEIKNKITNVTTKYKKEKAKICPSGGTPSDWHLYEAVHAVIGSAKSVNTEGLVMESCIDTPHSYEILDEIYLKEYVGDQSLSTPAVVEEDAPTPATPSSTIPSESPGPSISRAARNKNSFQTQIIQSMKSTDDSIKTLMSEIKESRKVEEENSQAFRLTLSTMCEEFSLYLRRQQ